MDAILKLKQARQALPIEEVEYALKDQNFMSHVANQPLDLASIRQYLLAMPLTDLPAALRQLDHPTLLDINLSKGRTKQVFVHDLIDQHLSPSGPFEYFIEQEQMMIDALSALEVMEFNIYDTIDKSNLNALQSVIDTVTSYPDWHQTCHRLIAHIATKVTDVNAFNGNEVWNNSIGPTNSLMDVVITGDLDIVNILLEAGADPDIMNEKGVNCNIAAEFYKNSHQEFYLNFRALMLSRSHQANLSTKPRGRGL